jgi:uncharacterized protein YlxW (UPF0749 family)
MRRRGHLLAATLLGLLGFSVVVQAQQTQGEGLTTLGQSDLLRLLDNVSERNTRLEEEARSLQQQSERLRSGSDTAAAAEQAARERAGALGVLAGTVVATGPGITLDITDPTDRLTAAVLLNAVQELRDAGAEALQIDGSAVGGRTVEVRVVAQTAFVDGPDVALVVDGVHLSAPYRLLAVGDPQTLASALRIPGGVLDTFTQSGARGVIQQLPSIRVAALRPIRLPQYARPA